MNYEFVCGLIDKLWCTTEDIQKICNNCSYSTAMTIRKEVEEQVIKSGKRIPSSKYRVVPTLLTLDYLGIDVDRVLEMGRK